MFAKTAVAVALIALSVGNLVEKKLLNEDIYIQENKTFAEVTRTQEFYNGDEYYHKRISYNEDLAENFSESIEIYGEEITIRYVNPETKEKIVTNDITDIIHTTLLISTEKESYFVGVPSVYSTDTTSQTLQVLHEEEIPLTITKEDGKYSINFEFSHKMDMMSEYWYFKTFYKASYFNEDNIDFLVHDLTNVARFAIDGYYFLTPYNYVPTGENVYYKHPSCLAGISLAKYGQSQFSLNIGYAFVDIYLESQNEYGFWETGPKSEWLYTDFGFEEGFYDTRFNADFVNSLIVIYQKNNSSEYYNAICKYMEFFEMLIDDYSYESENGGIFVVDYYHPNSTEKSHVSLNHFVTEIYGILNWYEVTNDEKYLDYANKMILAIEDTRDEWILENGNLEYALFYEYDTNLMQDYLYLTYNDMFKIQKIIERVYGQRNETIDYLMDSKREWLIKNNAHDYSK